MLEEPAAVPRLARRPPSPTDWLRVRKFRGRSSLNFRILNQISVCSLSALDAHHFRVRRFRFIRHLSAVIREMRAKGVAGAMKAGFDRADCRV